MTTPVFYVHKSGLETTLQDQGRPGFQQYGITESGAMDGFALAMGNFLAGNHPDAPALEITMAGPELEMISACTLALAGGDLGARLNGERLASFTSFYVQPGDRLTFDGPVFGVRTYLTVAGGLIGTKTLGSTATFEKAAMGGIDGRKVRKGDTLTRGSFHKDFKTQAGKRVHADLADHPYEKRPLRVLTGPEWEAFTEDGRRMFLSNGYQVTGQSNRMGYRLHGPDITHEDRADILSDAVPFGTIQVAADGQPMIMMADRQTTGGYTRIGHVITADHPYLAQLKPGDEVTFQLVSMKKAHEALSRQQMACKKFAFARGLT
ncbi:biotin-dependent carboxylase-like uncharacterized protein [Salsuginibacillus halophilus]|uniref:Biotin-dependent carboxylase-like uncharacterized protein n=1 Tax=Salsuginibacillus halophilus TaxID=517424 RepID=A0A2P8HI86_9BACI|nr:biotin-dependent carboxyltransferase family protein [Salsuginibacillus halophilus]PSL45880.1 biotin-dependent carboxylase-like uncharacterized protein [Salsuginibacillus halophilus]